MWTDAMLNRQLTAFLTAINGDGNWSVHLYKNNHTPVAGDTIAAYTEADFLSYAAVNFLPSTFGAVSVAAHVAQSVSSVTANFTEGAGGTLQTIYGYYLLNDAGTFVGAEMFSSSLDITALGTISVVPTLKHTILPP